MSQTLPEVAHEHHERILAVIDRLPAIADSLMTAPTDQVTADVASTRAFLDGTLLPHIAAAERTLYPELERMLQNRHSMAPMRREHEEVLALVATYDRLAVEIRHGRVDLGEKLSLRRVMFQLYALLKIHLVEEEAYLRIIEHGSSAEVRDAMAAALEHPMLIERDAVTSS
jgi:hemerythrin-like domain-containing protein